MSQELLVPAALVSEALVSPISLLIAGSVLWEVRPGKYFAKTYRRSSKVLTRVTRYFGDLLGVRESITISRELDDGSKYIFKFKGVPEVDAATDPTSAKYDITLVVTKPESGKLCLGEIDFSNWEERQDFQIIITDVHHKAIDKTSPTYAKVLAQIKVLPKVLANGKNLAIDLVETIQPSTWMLLDWVKKKFQNKTVRQYVYWNEGYEFLYSDKFIDSIVTIAASNIRSSQAILDNYLEVAKYSVTCQLQAVTAIHDQYEREVKEKEQKFSIYRYLTAGQLVIALSLFALIGAVIVLTIFNLSLLVSLLGPTAAGILQVGVGIATAIIDKSFAAVKDFFVGAFNTVGLTTLNATLGAWVLGGAVQVYRDGKGEALDNAKRDFKDVTDLLAEIKHHQEGIIGAEQGVKRVLEALEKVAKSKGLDLSNTQAGDIPIGGMGAKLLRTLFADPKLLEISGCEMLNLSGNSLQKAEWYELGLMIQNSHENRHFVIENIDLRRNPVHENLNGQEEIIYFDGIFTIARG